MLPNTPSPSQNRQAALAGLILVITTLAVFGGVVRNEFTWWDDQRTIHHNPQFNPPTPDKILHAWTAPAYGLYVPVTYSFWGALACAAETKEVDAAGIHLDPRVFHIASLILHLAAVLVVFSILRLLGTPVWAGAVGAMFFAIHPVQVEPIAWASGAKDLLAGLLSLCAIHQYLIYARGGISVAKARFYYFSSIPLLLLAMLAKPSAIVAPLIIAILDSMILRRPWRKVALCAGLWLAVLAPLAVVAKIVQQADGVAPTALWQKPLIAADAITFYLYKLVWPASLGPDYGRRPEIALGLLGGSGIYLSALVLVFLAAAIGFARKRIPFAVPGALIFLAALLPVLGFVPFMFQYMSTVADHYLYLAMLGPALILASLATTLARSSVPALWLRSAAAAGAAAALALCLRSHEQTAVWRDDATLWSHTINACPDSFVAPNNLATNMGRQSVILAELASEARDAGDRRLAADIDSQRKALLEKAVALLERSLARNPDYPTARQNAFVYCMRLDRPAQAVAHLEELFRANGAVPAHMRDNYTTYHHTAGLLWMRVGRYDRAVAHFDHLLKLVPDHATAPAELELAKSRLAQARIE